MPAYNPPDQILFSPVTNYYKGKAIRQQLEAGKVDLDLKKLELADAPSKRATAKAYAEAQLENVQSQIAERIRNGEIGELKLNAKLLTPALTDYANEKDEDKAVDGFNEAMKSIIPNMSEKSQKAYAEAAGEDHAFDHNEIMLSGLGVRAFMDAVKGDRTAQKFIDRDGNPVQGSMDKQGNYFDSSGKQRTDITPIAPGATQESISGVSASGVSKSTIAFQDGVIGAVGAVQTGTELLIASETNPEALGVPGGFMRFGSNLVSGAKAIADWAGYEKLSLDDTENQTMGSSAFDYSKLDTDKLGISGAEAEKFRAGIYGIAFAAAVAEQGTRPTDKDIQQFIDQIGGRATSAQSFRETIVQFMRRQDRRLKTIADVKQIGPVDRGAAFKAWKPAFRAFMETYAKQSGKKTATNAETDERFIEMSPGNWEQF